MAKASRKKPRPTKKGARPKRSRKRKKKGGRPTEYRPQFPKQAARLSKLGATDREIAEFFGVTETTLNRWKLLYPRLCVSIKVGKKPSDNRVVQSLFKRATGYSFDSEKIYYVDGKVTRVKCVEHVPPSDTAMIFWLKNRMPELFRDKHDHELSGAKGKPIGIEAVGEPELLGAYYERQARIAAERRANPGSHPPLERDGPASEEPEGG